MPELSTADNSADQILAAFMLAYEAAADKPAVVEEFCDRHSDLAAEIRALVEAEHRVQDAQSADAARPRRLKEGDRIGPYRVVRFLAAGGMGEVYKAREDRLGRDVALKVIRNGRIAPADCDRFLREQKVLARLHQTHIAPIYASAADDDLQYFAMPHIDGVALHTVVRSALARETSRHGGSTPSLPELVGSLVDGPAS